MRIGTNHGSLSDRILNRYGDTPLGMVESAIEFASIARGLGYHAFVFSMKASNPKVMIAAYRLLVARLRELGPDWNYPIHLGVTEAGDGEDGRIKSAIGIGSLLSDGIGDTVRVSLTEDSIHEIPVARALVKMAACEPAGISTGPAKCSPNAAPRAWTPFQYARRPSERIGVQDFFLGGTELPRVALPRDVIRSISPSQSELKPELTVEDLPVHEVDPTQVASIESLNAREQAVLVTIPDGLDLSPIGAFRLLAEKLDPKHPILLKDTFAPLSPGKDGLDALLRASVHLGSLLCDGIGDAIWVRSETHPDAALRLSYNLLQAAGSRIFKTDYVACPSCGRTLFNLQETTARIRAATNHLKGVKIAIMGCIVNGPGEMADADFGYVGGAPHKINLYVGKTPVKFNIPEEEAVDRLKDLIAEHGKWVDP
jgi:(E)-4-hydroxy-3-methylbut-2-enyl-diphosphate synthase